MAHHSKEYPFLFGVFEASFCPWICSVSELSLRVATHTGNSTLSDVLDCLIACGFGNASALKISAKRSIFIIEGFPTTAFGIPAF